MNDTAFQDHAQPRNSARLFGLAANAGAYARRLPLSTRLVVSMCALVVVTAGSVALLTLHNLEATLGPLRLERLTRNAERLATDLEHYADGARADLLALTGGEAAQALARSEAGDSVGDAQKRARIAARLLIELKVKPEYYQFQVIGLANGGREIIRVDRATKDGAPRIVPDDELERNVDARDFRDGGASGFGGVNASPIMLKRERGEIEDPPVPVLRLAMPLRTPRDLQFGAVVLDVDMRPAFKHLQAFAPRGGEIRVANADGEYLLHPAPGSSFRFEYGGSSRVLDEFPALGSLVASPDGGSMVVSDRSGASLAAAVRPGTMAGGTRFSVIDTVPQTDLVAAARPLRNATLVAGTATAGVAAIVAFLLARSISRPIEQMTKAVEDFSGRELPPVPVAAGGALGRLARALTRMAGDVKDRSAQLRDEIANHQFDQDLLRHYAEQERLFTAVVQSSTDAVITETLDGTITAWNQAAQNLFGYAPQQAVGHSIDMIVPAELRGEVRVLLDKVSRGEHIAHHETVRQARDGRLIDVSLSISPIKSHTGTIIGAAKILRDVTEPKLAQTNFRLAVEASPSGVLMIDRNGAIVLANAEIERLFGYARDELLGRPVESLVPERFRGGHGALRDMFFAAPTVRPMGADRDLNGARKDGSEFPVEIGLNPIQSRHGMLVLAVVIDISSRKREAAAIARYTEELRRSNTELEQFAYVASHDLQEPLRMVASFTQLLADRYRGKLDDKADQYIQHAVDGAKRMQGLVRDLLHFSRVTASERSPQPVDAANVVESVLVSLSPAIADCKAEVVTGTLPAVLGDETELEQVFQNLIANALKFHGDQPARILVDAQRHDGEWIFRVQDNGIGIDAKHHERIFQMFQRLHQRGKYGGNGIGLAVVKKIVERQGGRIWIESRLGEGATFFFTVPDHQAGIT